MLRVGWCLCCCLCCDARLGLSLRELGDTCCDKHSLLLLIAVMTCDVGELTRCFVCPCSQVVECGCTLLCCTEQLEEECEQCVECLTHDVTPYKVRCSTHVHT